MIPPRDRFEEIKQARIKVIKRWHSSKWDQMLPVLEEIEEIVFLEHYRAKDTVSIKRTYYENKLNILQLKLFDENIFHKIDKEEYTKSLLEQVEYEIMRFLNGWRPTENYYEDWRQ